MGNKFLKIGSSRYKLRDVITKERKEQLEKHPHNKYFLFKRSSRGYNWYVKTIFGKSDSIKSNYK